VNVIMQNMTLLFYEIVQQGAFTEWWVQKFNHHFIENLLLSRLPGMQKKTTGM